MKTRQWILTKKPHSMPVLEGSDQTFKLVEEDLPDLKDDQLLVKLVYLSNDPAQRGWIGKDIDPERLYRPAVKEGEPMHARGVAEVVESKSDKFKKGDMVVTNTGWSEYAVVAAKTAQPAADLPGGLGKTHYLGALGLTGLTAYFGLTEVGKITKDDILVVSGAAGATGMMVVQIAKKIVGCKKVIGFAGSDEKCKWVESLGADQCLNYKKDSFKEDLNKALPRTDGWATVYYDNVGGAILDEMLTHMQLYGRIICCGAISSYNSSSDQLYGIQNWFEVISMRLKIQGFIVLDYMQKASECLDVLKKGLADGKLSIEEGEHIVKAKFEDVPKTWLELFNGGNTGKLVTAIQ